MGMECPQQHGGGTSVHCQLVSAELSHLITTLDDVENGFRHELLPMALSHHSHASQCLKAAILAGCVFQLGYQEDALRYKARVLRSYGTISACGYVQCYECSGGNLHDALRGRYLGYERSQLGYTSLWSQKVLWKNTKEAWRCRRFFRTGFFTVHE